VASNAIGLDIGEGMVRAVEVAGADKPRPRIVRYSEISLPEGSVVSGEVREIQTVASAIRRLWSTGGFKSRKVVLGMGNQRVIARDFAVPRMSLTQIRESLPFQVQDLLPVPVHDSLLDFYPVSEGMGDHGPIVNGLLIAAIKDSVRANVDAAIHGGLEPVGVDLIPFALTRVMARGAIARGTIAIVDIGGSTTNVVIATNGIPQFVRMIPVGGDDITRALVSRLDMSPQQAEGAKRTRGFRPVGAANDSDRQVGEAINAAVSELLSNLRNTINFYLNSHQNEIVQALMLSGGGSLMPGLPAALAEQTRIQVIPAEPFKSLELSRTVSRQNPADQWFMTVALGLALGAEA
jgi:type IV pilus assembly protein PilM